MAAEVFILENICYNVRYYKSTKGKILIMKLQQLLSYTRKALDDYQMLEDGDKVAIGVSGGKDSLTLLYALSGIRRFYPKKFEIEAITVKTGFPNMDFSLVQNLCNELNINYTVVETDIAEIVFQHRK